MSELPSVSTRLPETSSSILALHCGCPLKVRLVANWNVGTGLSSCSPRPPVWWLDFSSACPEHACSTRSEVTLQQCKNMMFSPFFLSLAMSTPEFLQPFPQICYSFDLFLEAEVPSIQLYKCLLWITPWALTRCENEVRSSCLVTRPCRWPLEEQKLLI